MVVIFLVGLWLFVFIDELALNGVLRLWMYFAIFVSVGLVMFLTYHFDRIVLAIQLFFVCKKKKYKFSCGLHSIRISANDKSTCIEYIEKTKKNQEIRFLDSKSYMKCYVQGVSLGGMNPVIKFNLIRPYNNSIQKETFYKLKDLPKFEGGKIILSTKMRGDYSVVQNNAVIPIGTGDKVFDMMLLDKKSVLEIDFDKEYKMEAEK